VTDIKRPIPLPVRPVPPIRTDRDQLADIKGTLQLVLGQVQGHGQRLGSIEAKLDEVMGHLLRIDSKASQASNHDLSQDAQLAEITQRIAVVETGWRRVGQVIDNFFKDGRTKSVARLIFTLAMGYAAAKGIRVLP